MKRRIWLLNGAIPLSRLALEPAEGGHLALDFEDPLDSSRSHGPNQLVFQVLHADEEPQLLQIGSAEIRAHPGPFQSTLEVRFLTGVAQAGQLDIASLWPQEMEELPDGGCSAHRQDRDALAIEIPPSTPGQGVEGRLIAETLHKDHRTRFKGRGEAHPLLLIHAARGQLSP